MDRGEHWPLEKLQAYASNARIHPSEQVQEIAASMMEFGVVNPVLIAPDGTISQEAALKLYDLWKVDIWLEAKRQSDIDGMIAIISKLPTFTQKPKPISSQ